MIQDIAPHIYHNEYHPEKPDADSYLMYFEKHNALANWDGKEITFPRFRDFPEVKTRFRRISFICSRWMIKDFIWRRSWLCRNVKDFAWRVTEDSGTPSLSGCPLRVLPAISSALV